MLAIESAPGWLAATQTARLDWAALAPEDALAMPKPGIAQRDYRADDDVFHV